MFRIFFLVFFIFETTRVSAQSVFKIKIKKAQHEIKLDGKLDEVDWEFAEEAGNFFQNFPNDTSFAISKTRVKMTWNDLGLYVGAVCEDPLPGSYLVQSLKRDFSFPSNDAFVVSIDPISDQTYGFSFATSPLAVQREGTIEDRGMFGVTTSWDNRWYSSVYADSNQYVCEYFIPFKTLRYKPEKNIWRVNFGRNDMKRNEVSTWVPVPRNFNISSLAYAGEIEFDQPLPKAGKNISLIPFVTASASEDYFLKLNIQKANAGLNAKVGVSSSLNLDLAFNPDFSQVEVDQQVTNLSRFSIFFPERREFFIENSDLFSRFGFRNIRPFYSRKIGLASGQTVPILMGARLSGRLNEKWRIGIMEMQTEGVSKLNLFSQNYFVGAVQRQIGERSNIAGIFVNRQGFSNFNTIGHDFNRTVGLDYNLSSKNNHWSGKIFTHYNINPIKKNDTYAHAVYLNYNTRKWDIMYNHELIGRNYNPDVGFVPRVGVLRLEPGIGYTMYPKNSVINNHGPYLYNDSYFSLDGSKLLDSYSSLNYSIGFQNSAGLTSTISNTYIYLYEPFDPSGTRGTPHEKGAYSYQSLSIGGNTNRRKLLNCGINVGYGTYFSGKQTSLSGDIAYRAQPWGNFSITFNQNWINFQNPFPSSSLTLIGTRIELTFTRKIFFTTFLQYNTQTQNININARFQYRFAPMSDIYLVYTDNYDSRYIYTKNKALVFKINYWLGL